MSSNQDKMDEIEAMLDQLYTDEEQERWWIAHHPALGTSALEAVKAGRYDEIIASLKQVLDCAYI